MITSYRRDRRREIGGNRLNPRIASSGESRPLGTKQQGGCAAGCHKAAPKGETFWGMRTNTACRRQPRRRRCCKRRSIHLRNLLHPLTKQWGAWRNAYVKKIRTPRRRCPKHETRRAVSGIQWRLQPPRCATTAWQANLRAARLRLGNSGARDGRRRRAIPTFWKGTRCA